MRFNRLLDYRSREQLERLTEGERAALAAEIAGGPPSREAWQALYELFALWPDDPARWDALDAAARQIATWEDRLRTVDSSSAPLFDAGRLTPLARLAAGIEIYRREDRGGGELTAVASSDFVRELRRLTIDRSDVVGRPWSTLAESRVLDNLRHLHVIGASVGFDGVPQLLRSRALPALECLKLIELGMTVASLDGVRRTIPFPHLRQLDLSRNVLRNEGAVLLANAPWLGGIERLSVQRNYIDAAGAHALVASPHVRSLEQLDLSGNDVADADRAALRQVAQSRGMRLIV
jgi:hypothetical protein